MPAKYLQALGEERRPELHRQMGCVTGILQAFDLAGVHHSHKRLLPPGNALSSSPSVGEERTRYGPQIVFDKNLSKSWTENQRALSTVESSQTSSYSSSSCSSFSTEAVEDHTFNGGDPLRFLDESPSSGIQGKSKGTMDINESLRVLAKLRESSWNNPSESVQQPRLSYDAPRFSYDGLREMPGLSLDIKESPLRTCAMDLRPKPSVNSAERSSGSDKEQPVCKRLPSVVAKLMGLEELPEPNDNTVMPSQVSRSVQEPMLIPLSLSSHNDPTPPRQQRNLDATVRHVANSKFPVETALWKQQERIVLPRKLPKGSKGAHGKEQQPAASVYSEIEKRLKDLDFQQSNKDLRALKQILDSMEAKGLLQNKKREEASMLKLYDDSHDSREVADPNLRLNGNTNSNQMPQVAQSSSMEEQSNAERFFKAPIVIMKPAKSADLLSDADSSVIPLGGLSDVPQLRTGDGTDKKKSTQINRAAIEQHPKSSSGVPDSQPLASYDRRENGRNQVISRKQKSSSQLMTESSSSRQQLPRDNNGSLLKHKNSTTPRLTQKELDVERRARPPIPSLESKNQRLSAVDTVLPRSKIRRKSAQSEDDYQNGAKSRIRRLNQTESSSRRQQLPRDNNGSLLKHKNSTSPILTQKKLDVEWRARPPIPSLESKNQRLSAVDTVSPRSKIRRKSAQSEDSHQNGAKSRIRRLNQQGDDLSTRSDGSMSVASDLDIKVTSADRSADVYSFQQGNQTSSGRNPQKVRTSYDASKDLPSTDPASTIPERPSPVSLLDSSFDQENFFRTNKASSSPNVDDEHHPSDESRKPSGTKPTKPTAQPKNSKLANVASLIQKLQQSSISKDDDEAPPVDHIAFLCETQNPDHRYVAEILLASGLLMENLGSGLSQIQLHASGYPINPDLFLVLEQRRSGGISELEGVHLSRSDDPMRAHRKLMFDTVNQLLLEKFEKETSVQSVSSLSLTTSGQQLVKTICSEMEYLKMERSRMCQEDSSSVIPDTEILRRMEGWTTSLDRQELPGMVLEIERLIVKELIDEVARDMLPAGQGRQEAALRLTAKCECLV